MFVQKRARAASAGSATGLPSASKAGPKRTPVSYVGWNHTSGAVVTILSHRVSVARSLGFTASAAVLGDG
jgi:hypothetical protein